jgi:hypothetical protein
MNNYYMLLATILLMKRAWLRATKEHVYRFASFMLRHIKVQRYALRSKR